jgi:hypothetical protein
MKKINLKKSNILEGLGKTKKIHETYGSKPQEIMVSEEQLTRLMEKQYNEQLTPPVDAEVGDSEDFYTDMTVTNEEEIFDDYRHGGRPTYEKGKFNPGYVEDQSEEGFDEDEIGAYLNMNKLRDYELGEEEYMGAPDKVEKRDTYDGRPGKVIGVYSNIKDQRLQEDEKMSKEEVAAAINAHNKKEGKLEEGKKKDHDGDGDIDSDDWKSARDKAIKQDMKEDSEGEETYNYGEDEGRDEYRLKHDDMSRSHRRNLKKDMAYDEDHEDRGEYGTHFESVDDLYQKSQLEQIDLMIMETFDAIKSSIIRERIRGLKRTDYMLNEQSEWQGRNPGSSAASGIENIVANLKKAWNFIKDEKTRHQIMNTLTKLDNFMTYTAELVGSGRDQRGPRSYDSVSKPLPYPEVEEDEALEDIDDEIDMNEEDLELE